jgi:cytochrome oxidase Cu insertion factor (SCO1/SenC/PrrC family)
MQTSFKTNIAGLVLAALICIGALSTGAATAVEAGDSASANRPELALGRTSDYDYDPPEPGTYQLPVIQPAEDGAVLGPDGNELSLHDLFEGRIVVLSFIYTRCTDPRACLRATGVLNQLQRLTRQDAELAQRVLLVTLSFDPENDTPEVMGRYGRVFQSADSGAEWLFLTTRGKGALQPLLEAYGQRVDRRKEPGPYGPLYHPLRVYLIDREQRIRNIYSQGLLDPRLVMTDLRTLSAHGVSWAIRPQLW